MRLVRLLFVLTFLVGPMILLMSCETPRNTTMNYPRRDTTTTTKATVAVSPTWPPDTVSVSFAGPGIIMLSSGGTATGSGGWSATYRLVPFEQTQGGIQSGTAIDRFRALLMEQPVGMNQGSLLFLKTPSAEPGR